LATSRCGPQPPGVDLPFQFVRLINRVLISDHCPKGPLDKFGSEFTV